MTDKKTTPTEEDRRLAREWAEHVESSRATWGDRFRAAARVILNAVPAPPTLADMTLDEQDECAGMQADLAQGDRVVILDGTPDSDDSVQVLEMSLDVFRPWSADVTPRPDLPRLSWPGDTPEAVPPNTLTVGSEWGDVDALNRACDESGRDQIVVADKDGEVFVWGADAEWWETGLPGCDYAPHKILHTGRKADW